MRAPLAGSFRPLLAGLISTHDSGANMGYRAFLVGYESRGDGAVILTNGDRGDQLGDEILRSIAAMYQWPDFHPIERSAVALSLASELLFVGSLREKILGFSRFAN
jgi:hypothetical protein